MQPKLYLTTFLIFIKKKYKTSDILDSYVGRFTGIYSFITDLNILHLLYEKYKKYDSISETDSSNSFIIFF